MPGLEEFLDTPPEGLLGNGSHLRGDFFFTVIFCVLDYCLGAGTCLGSLHPGLDACVAHGGGLGGHREHYLIR